MPVITGQSVRKAFGTHEIIHGATFAIEPGDRIGLVGRNGEGKTTLLRLLARMEEVTDGSIQARRDVRIGYLPQHPPAPAGQTLWEAMEEAFGDLHRLHAEMDRLAAALEAEPSSAELLAQFGAAQEAFEARDGYNREVKIKTILTGLGFAPAQYSQPMAQLSGGQRTRAFLGRLLLEEPDVLLLDEPTNHLDLEAVDWLEQWLAGLKSAIVVVSHDRYFLDRVSTWVWEIAFCTLETFRGNYSAYLRQRHERVLERVRTWQAQQDYIAKQEEIIRRLMGGQRPTMAQSRKTLLERFKREEAIDKPRDYRDIRVRLTPSLRSGDLVVRTRGLSAGYGRTPLVHVGDLEVRRGQRVAIVGGNGTGKTTLLRTLIGALPPVAGSADLGASIVLGYLPQTHENLQPERTILQTLHDAAPELSNETMRTVLGSFLFTDEEVHKKIRDLSGGERARVVLACLAVKGHNVLALDEPTNHLDIASREVLQTVLADFEGTLLFVSHDRFLIDAMATHTWAIEDGTLHEIAGGWKQYLDWRTRRAATAQADADRRRAAAEAAARRDAEAAARQQQAQRLRHNEARKLRRRAEQIEADIKQRETRLSELTLEISHASTAEDFEKVRALSSEYAQVDKTLKRLWDQWTDISESLEGVLGD